MIRLPQVFMRRSVASRRLGGLPALAIGASLVFALFAHAQTFTVLHPFTGGADGAEPIAGVIADPAGNLYGTAAGGGSQEGVVYKYSVKNHVLTPLFTFNGADGAIPVAPVLRDPSGVLYGTTRNGGTANHGSAFELSPGPSRPVSVISPWTEPRLYSFGSGTDGETLVAGLIRDSAGNLYGTTNAGGSDINRVGTIFELSPAGNGWTETILYNFTKNNDVGCYPDSPVVFDSAGNLYGTANLCGDHNVGTVYELVRSDSGWTPLELHAFNCAIDGCQPTAGLIFDAAGNLYGATTAGGANSAGTVFEMSPSENGWTFQVIWNFKFDDSPSFGPASGLAMDAQGNLYGATQGFIDDNDPGHVFKLVYSNGSWTEQILYQFTFGDDGGDPLGSVLLDSAGNLYGTASLGGHDGYGTLWDITP